MSGNGVEQADESLDYHADITYFFTITFPEPGRKMVWHIFAVIGLGCSGQRPSVVGLG